MNEEITFKMCQDPIIKETRKAFLLAFSVDQFRGNTRYTMLKKWIPMSVILKIECNRLTVKKWFAKKELHGMTLINGKSYSSIKLNRRVKLPA